MAGEQRFKVSRKTGSSSGVFFEVTGITEGDNRTMETRYRRAKIIGAFAKPEPDASSIPRLTRGRLRAERTSNQRSVNPRELKGGRKRQRIHATAPVTVGLNAGACAGSGIARIGRREYIVHPQLRAEAFGQPVHPAADVSLRKASNCQKGSMRSLP